MGKKYQPPNTDNLTPSGAVDHLALWRENKKEAEFYEGFYKEWLKARMRSEAKTFQDGDRFQAQLIPGQQERIDVTKIREDAVKGNEFAQKVLDTYLKVSPMETVKTFEKAPESKP